MELDPGFKDRLKWAITTKETSQSALARHLGVSAQAIQQWAAGATLSPRREHVVAASDFLGCRYEWLAYGRGPMKETELRDGKGAGVRSKNLTESAILGREWEMALRAALPKGDEEHWQVKMPHPSGAAQMRVSWLSDEVIGEVGLYQDVNLLISNARQRLWLLAFVRESLPAVPGRRCILLLAPLEDGTRYLTATSVPSAPKLGCWVSRSSM